MIKWITELDYIRENLEKGVTLEKIGEHYNVSRQRMYQVLQKFGLSTPTRDHKTYLKDKPPKYYWLNSLLVNKGVSREERQRIMNNIVIPDICPVFGTVLNYNGTGTLGWANGGDSASIDQIIAGGGYTLGNVAIMSWKANRLKSDGTAEEHLKIYQFVEDFISKNNIIDKIIVDSPNEK